MRPYWSDALRIVGTVLLGISMVSAQEATTSIPNDSISSASNLLRLQREALANRIRDHQQQFPETENQQSQSESIMRQFRTADSIYLQHQMRLDDLRRLEGQLKEAQRELDDVDSSGPAEPKPYSFLLLEKSRDQLVLEKQREEEGELVLKSAKQALEKAHRELAEWEARRMREQSASATASDTAKAEKSAEDGLEELIARANIAWRNVEVNVAKVAVRLFTTRRKTLEARIEILAKDLEFSTIDRDKQLEDLAGIETDLKSRRRSAETQGVDFEVEHRRHLDTLTEQNSADTVRNAAIDIWRQVLDLNRSEIVLADDQLELTSEIRKFWKRRFEFTNEKVESKTLDKWKEELDEFVERLEDASKSLSRRRDRLSQDAGQPDASDQLNSDSALTWWIDLRKSRRLVLRDEYDASLQRIQAWVQSLARFQTDLKFKVEKNSKSGFFDPLNAVFGYELAESEDEKITIGRVLHLLVYIIVGLYVAYGLSRLVAVRLLAKFGIQLGNAVAIRSIAFYFLSLIVGVVAFQLLNIPISAFQFLVGATTIAIAFASRDIMNNFMSGVILLFERPVRVGDAIQLGDLRGKVKHIGLRSTRLTTESNQDLILPNSTLLDKQVLNFTLSDQYVLLSVVLDVDPDIQVDEAKSKMLAAASTHSLVVKVPSPFVLLKASDCYSLQFEIRFWVEHSSFVKCSVIQSEILEAATRVCRIPKPADVETKSGDTSNADDALDSDATANDTTQSGPADKTSNNRPGGLSRHDLGLVNKMLRHKV